MRENAGGGAKLVLIDEWLNIAWISVAGFVKGTQKYGFQELLRLLVMKSIISQYRFLLLAIRYANTIPPKPLSMSTTATSEEQLCNMANKSC